MKIVLRTLQKLLNKKDHNNLDSYTTPLDNKIRNKFQFLSLKSCFIKKIFLSQIYVIEIKKEKNHGYYERTINLQI